MQRMIGIIKWYKAQYYWRNWLNPSSFNVWAVNDDNLLVELKTTNFKMKNSE